jgi:methylenetetrahydrofolate dehydrogenase (NADP+)/methenyltetrahydrofolate cyclohydrolase
MISHPSETHPPKILHGTIAAAAIRQRCLVLHQYYQKTFGDSVRLGVLSIGDNPASRVYIRHKKEMALALGFEFFQVSFPQDTPNDVVMVGLKQVLPKVHGMIVQLPIVPISDATLYLTSIPWDKDVDGLNPRITGPMAPCTPLGCWFLLQHYGIPVAGKTCVIVGRSHLVGRPLAKILLDHHATVTVAHSHTPDLACVTRKADILFVATGARHLITPEYVQPNSIVLDIGIHRTEKGLTGDVHPDVYGCVRSYSPVPGGVGPMTVVTLMWNTLKAAFLQNGITLSDEQLGRSLTSSEVEAVASDLMMKS